LSLLKWKTLLEEKTVRVEPGESQPWSAQVQFQPRLELSEHLFTRIQSPSDNWTVWYSNGNFPDKICVWFSNGKIGHLVFNDLKTGPVFRPQYIGKANCPFENQTSLSGIQKPFEYQII
jgi:hypothetical protein